MRKFFLIGLAALFMALSACSTTELMSSVEFETASAEEQQAELDRLRKKPVEMETFWKLKLLAFEPVEWKYDGVDYTLQCFWNPRKEYRELAIYHGQDAPSFDRDTTSAFAVVLANEDCETQLRATGDLTEMGEPFYAPITLRNDSSMSEGFWSALALRTGPAMLQNTGAIALQNALGPDCPKGSQCGGIANYVRADSTSGAFVDQTQDQDLVIEVDVCDGCAAPD